MSYQHFILFSNLFDSRYCRVEPRSDKPRKTTSWRNPDAWELMKAVAVLVSKFSPMVATNGRLGFHPCLLKDADIADGIVALEVVPS